MTVLRKNIVFMEGPQEWSPKKPSPKKIKMEGHQENSSLAMGRGALYRGDIIGTHNEYLKTRTRRVVKEASLVVVDLSSKGSESKKKNTGSALVRAETYSNDKYMRKGGGGIFPLDRKGKERPSVRDSTTRQEAIVTPQNVSTGG